MSISKLLVRILIAAAVFQMFDAVAVTMTGALRGAGSLAADWVREAWRD